MDALKSEISIAVLTNVLLGRLASGITNKIMEELDFIAGKVAEFFCVAIAIAPLRSKAESQCKSGFTPLWPSTIQGLAP